MLNLVLVGAHTSPLGDVAAHCLDRGGGSGLLVVSGALELEVCALRDQQGLPQRRRLAGLAGLAEPGSQVVGLEHLPESEAAAVCLSNGDILQVPLSNSSEQPECVGTVDSGAMAMAWSPDGEIVVFCTGNASLFCLSRNWMPVAEVPLHPDGQAQRPVSFSISWEADGSRFVTNTRFADGSVSVTLWTRDCIKLASCALTKEASSGSDDPRYSPAVCFRPTGFLVATGFGNEVILYESNGLEKDRFRLPKSSDRIQQLLWNADASLLALTTVDGALQVWRMANYQWQLCFARDSEASRILAWAGPLRLLVEGSSAATAGEEKKQQQERWLRDYRWIWDSNSSALRAQSPDEWAWVPTVAGTEVRLTCIRERVVPPPMSQLVILQPWVPASVSVRGTRAVQLVALSSDGRWAVDGKEQESILLDAAKAEGINVIWQQAVWSFDGTHIWFLASQRLLRVCLASKAVDVNVSLPPTRELRRIQVGESLTNGSVLLATGGRMQFVTEASLSPGTTDTVVELSESCPWVGLWKDEYLVCQSVRYRLFCVRLSSKQITLLEPECTSFALHATHVLWTTLTSQLRTALLESSSGLPPRHDPIFDRESETGALLVAVVPRGARTVVEAPRNSLETVYPRPLVLAAARGLLQGGLYGRAVRLLRKHKVDLAQLAAWDLPGLVKHATLLVSQVVDEHDDGESHLSLLLVQVGESKLLLEDEEVNRLCRAIAAVPGCPVSAVLTALVVQRPPAREEALQVVVNMRGVHQEKQPLHVATVAHPRTGREEWEKALDYLAFLVPGEELFDVALGMYDFDLVTVVAKRCQRDPLEYVPLLERLRAMPEPRMRHAVNMRLGRWARALSSLAGAGTEAYDECFQLVQDKRLYNHALQAVFASDEHQVARQRCWVLYGDYLEKKGRVIEAGECFSRAGDTTRALECAVRLGEWAHALCIQNSEATVATLIQLFEEERRDDDLAGLLMWSQLDKGAVAAGGRDGTPPALWKTLFRARRFSEARLVSIVCSVEHLYSEALDRLLRERSSALRGDGTRFEALVTRLRALRAERAALEASLAATEGADAALESETPSEYSVTSNASIASSTASGTSSLATLAQGRARRRAREASGKKKGGGVAKSTKGNRLTGKVGSMHEEEYLVRELRLLVPTEARLRECHHLLAAGLRMRLDAAVGELQAAQKGLISIVEASAADLCAPSIVYGPGGLSYRQHWRPEHLPPHTELAMPSESPSIDKELLLPTAVVPTTFAWELILLA